MHQPAFRDHMAYAPAKDFDDTEEYIYPEVKSCDWWCNEQVRKLNFVLATMIMTVSIATVAVWSYHFLFIWQFEPDTSYKLFGQQERMASIFHSRKHWLNDLIKTFNSCQQPSCPSSLPRKFHFKGHGKTATVKEQQIHNREDLWNAIELIFHHLDAVVNTRKLMLRAECRMRQCYPAMCAWMADYFENVPFHWIK